MSRHRFKATPTGTPVHIPSDDCQAACGERGRRVELPRPFVVTASQDSAEWPAVFGGAKITTALLAPLTRHCGIAETGNGRWRFKTRE
ncbi:ATP-binding protein [Cribrihabitans pelagius]|uniref:ATP-binding protein n=1 Tax=Cribrihabitans pelagius TaxID=1765746 RepID=UPI003B5B4A4A